MARFTTIVAVISPRAAELVRVVEAEASNVTAVHLGRIDDAGRATRLRTAWSEATRRRGIYTLVDFDPLSPLIDAWIDRLQGRHDALEVATATVEAGDLAEYVLVTDDADGDVVHWYHGLLRSFAPKRVITVSPTPGSVLNALGRLEPSPSFPSATEVARAALDYVPTGISVDEAATPEIALPRYPTRAP